MRKSLDELSNEYEKSIELTQQTLQKVRIAIAEAKRTGDYDRLSMLNREMRILYEEIVDMKIIAAKLRNYHNSENGRRVKNDYQQTYYS